MFINDFLKKQYILIYPEKQGRLTMTEKICPRCGYKEIGLVKKELLSKGGYRKSFRCPRCNHTWQKED
jgi:transposase